MRVNQHSRKHFFGDVSKRALASIKFYWVFSWFYNGSPLPLGLIGFLFVLFAELEVESKSKVSLTLCNNTFFFISQNLLLFCPRNHFQFLNIFVCFLSTSFHNTDLLQVTWKNACTMQNLLLEEVYPHVQDSSSIPKLDFMHTLVLEHFCIGVRCCLRIPKTMLQ